MINPREELVKRVTNTVTDLRRELIAAGVDPSVLAEQVAVEKTAEGVSIVFFSTDTEEARKIAPDKLAESAQKHLRKKAE